MAKVALVIGGAQGIGAETCRTLALDGLVVAVADLNFGLAQDVAGKLPDGAHRAFRVDVTEERSVEALFRDVEDNLGPVAILVCVAGGTFGGLQRRIVDISLDIWTKTEALNSRGTFLSVREYLRRRGKTPVTDGRIVTMSSQAGLAPGSATGPAYSAAKAAIIGFTRCAALEAAPLGITANAIAPGIIDTPPVRADMSDAVKAALVRNTPIGRVGEAAEIADLISFLVSPKAGYMTGCTIEINGGRHMA